MGRPNHKDDKSEDESEDLLRGSIESVYKLADFVMIHDLQNALIDLDLQDLEKNILHYSLRGVSTIFNLNLTSTPFYHMAIRSYCESIVGSAVFKDEEKKMIQDFDGDAQFLKNSILLCEDLRRTSWTPSAEEKDKCKYHIYPDGKKCAATAA